MKILENFGFERTEQEYQLPFICTAQLYFLFFLGGAANHKIVKMNLII